MDNPKNLKANTLEINGVAVPGLADDGEIKYGNYLTLADLERGTVYRDCDGPHGGDICVLLVEGTRSAQIASVDSKDGMVYYNMIVGPMNAPDAWEVNEVLAARPMAQATYTDIELVEHMARVVRREMGCEAFRDWVQDTLWHDTRETVLEAFERVADEPEETKP